MSLDLQMFKMLKADDQQVRIAAMPLTTLMPLMPLSADGAATDATATDFIITSIGFTTTEYWLHCRSLHIHYTAVH